MYGLGVYGTVVWFRMLGCSDVTSCRFQEFVIYHCQWFHLLLFHSLDDNDTVDGSEIPKEPPGMYKTL